MMWYSLHCFQWTVSQRIMIGRWTETERNTFLLLCYVSHSLSVFKRCATKIRTFCQNNTCQVQHVLVKYRFTNYTKYAFHEYVCHLTVNFKYAYKRNLFFSQNWPHNLRSRQLPVNLGVGVRNFKIMKNHCQAAHCKSPTLWNETEYIVIGLVRIFIVRNVVAAR